MELTHEDVLEILQLVEGSNVDYLELEVGGTRIVADRNGLRAPMAPAVAEEQQAPPGRPGPTPVAASAETAPATTADAPSPPQPTSYGGDLVTVNAPVVGVFYRSPEPGAPPFTEVGAKVVEDSTVGLVEVMKMFNSVTAGVRGRVMEILVENDSFVEFGQPLMTIAPETSG
jgi:acetyl-CoA carboxylase biotin carboxyl carrier protein